MHTIEDARESLADLTPQSLSRTIQMRPATAAAAAARGLPPAEGNRAMAFLRTVHAQEPLSDQHLYELERALDAEQLDLTLGADTRRDDVGSVDNILAAQIARAVVPGSDLRGPEGETFAEAIQRMRRRDLERTRVNSAQQPIDSGPWFVTPVLHNSGPPEAAIWRAER